MKEMYGSPTWLFLVFFGWTVASFLVLSLLYMTGSRFASMSSFVGLCVCVFGLGIYGWSKTRNGETDVRSSTSKANKYMLRQVFLENFVRFKEKQKLCFENGAHFFVGANNSGKSSFFEGIRRCLSTFKSTTLSSSYDDTKASIVLSIFATNETNVKIVSGIIGLPSETQDDKVYVKLASIKDGQCGIDVVKKDSTGAIVNKAVKAEDIKQSNCFNILNVICEEKVPETTQLIEVVKNLISTSGDDGFEKNNDTDCNDILEKLDACIVNTFPNRGIGPLQWSHSDLVDHNLRKSNYETSQNKAEIIIWYLTNQSKLKSVEKDSEQMYYKIITDDCGFDFKMSDKTLKCYSQRSDNEGSEISLLKVPEGLLEAKHCSILCAVTQFSTIILEDPEKGMHPQMISRMCNMVFNKIKDKVILVSSHHPFVINYKTIHNVFLFRPAETGNYSNIICVGEKMDECAKMKDKEMEKARLTNTDFRSIFYAKNVLIVEGKTDLWFIESLKVCLLDMNTDEIKCLLDQSLGVEKFQSSLSTLIPMSADSITAIEPYLKICSKLDIKAASLEDNNEDCEKSTQNNNFVWDVGDLEDVFIDFTNWHDTRRDTVHTIYLRPLLEKVLEFDEENVEENGALTVKIKRKRTNKNKKLKKKFGKKGLRNDLDEIVKRIIQISKEDVVKQMDQQKPGRQILNFVKFIHEFLTKAKK